MIASGYHVVNGGHVQALCSLSPASPTSLKSLGTLPTRLSWSRPTTSTAARKTQTVRCAQRRRERAQPDTQCASSTACWGTGPLPWPQSGWGTQVVLLSKLLSGRDTDGFSGCEDLRVHAFNGSRVQSLKHLAKMVHASRSTFLRFDLDHHVSHHADPCRHMRAAWALKR